MFTPESSSHPPVSGSQLCLPYIYRLYRYTLWVRIALVNLQGTIQTIVDSVCL